MSRAARSWATPAAVGVASAVGLAGALLLEGPVARGSAWLALSAPVAVVAWKVVAAVGAASSAREQKASGTRRSRQIT